MHSLTTAHKHITRITMASCPICADSYNRSSRKCVTCVYCKFEACTSCLERFILESTHEPHCMSPDCRAAWSQEFLADNFTQAFVHKRLRDHRRRQLFERELSLLPATQPLVEIKLRENETNKRLDELREKKAALMKEVAAINLETNKLYTQRYQAIVEARRVADGGPQHDPAAPGPSQPAPEKRLEFVRACPALDCRGFLSTQWKCGVCQLFACSECHEVKGNARDAPHTCKPENVESAKLLAKETKPCPKCGASSVRIAGCNQVWCISCHTAWNWNTRKVETGPVHAVDYYEFMRNNPNGAPQRNHGDIRCGGYPMPRQMQMLVARIKDPEVDALDLPALMRRFLHFYEVDGHRYRPDIVRDNAELRVKYMLKEIDEKHFMQILQQREKAQRKSREIYQVIETVNDVGAEIFRHMAEAASRRAVMAAYNELKTLLDYGREGFARIQKTYACTTPPLPQLVALPNV